MANTLDEDYYDEALLSLVEDLEHSEIQTPISKYGEGRGSDFSVTPLRAA